MLCPLKRRYRWFPNATVFPLAVFPLRALPPRLKAAVPHFRVALSFKALFRRRVRSAPNRFQLAHPILLWAYFPFKVLQHIAAVVPARGEPHRRHRLYGPQ